MKILLGAVFLIAICLTPMDSLNLTAGQACNDGITAAVSEDTSDYVIEKAADDRMLLQAGVSCDPQMLIPVDADNDPGLLLEPPS